MLRKIGKKAKAWMAIKPKLVAEYEENEITRCEGIALNHNCMVDWALSIHHLDKRSSGKAQHTFEATRLLCANCHDLADHPRNEEEKKFNQVLRTIR